MEMSLPSSGISSRPQVERDARAADHGKDHEGDPDDHRVDAEVTGQARSDAGQHAVLVGPAEGRAIRAPPNGASGRVSDWPVVGASGFTVLVFMPQACPRSPGQHIGDQP